MSHEIEQHGDVGLAVFNRVPAWHVVGTTYDGTEDLTLDKALKIAHMNGWDVRKVPIVGYDGDDAIEQDRWAMTVRNNPLDRNAPADPLGVVSKYDYTCVQNEEAFAFAERIMDEGMVVEAAGSLHDGRQPFILFRAPLLRIGGTDEVFPYIHIATSHDGSLAVTVNLTGVRVVCKNTQAMALSMATPRYKVVHMGTGVEGKVADARAALDMTFEGMTAFQAEADRLIDTEITAAKFDKIVEAVWPDPKSDWAGAQTQVDTRREQFRSLFAGDTNTAITGTAWGALQAAWEQDEWSLAPDDPVKAANRSLNRDGNRISIARTVLAAVK